MEIKLRLFDTLTNTMITEENIDDICEKEKTIFDNTKKSEWERFCPYEEVEIYPFVEVRQIEMINCFSRDKRFKMMQYIGLKDKNGKDIYQGDIVKLTESKLKTEWLAVVEFGNPNGDYTWGWQLKPISDNAIKYKYNLDILCWVGMEDVGVYCEIVGNIFENKNLVVGNIND